MRFDPPLIPGFLIRRYKRFFADVRLDDGRIVTAHCPNTGSMLGCSEPESRCYLSFNPSPKRTLHYTLEIVAASGSLVGVNTARTNNLVAETLEAGGIREIPQGGRIKREVIMGNSRLDFAIEYEDETCYLEAKNVTLAEGKTALFPDAVSERGTKHLETLIRLAAQGKRAVIFFAVARQDCSAFEPAAAIDSVYARTLSRATRRGVQALAYAAHVSPTEIRLHRSLPIHL